jgi:RsiW-degrading membrane proteinase PrsW (M82 family)
MADVSPGATPDQAAAPAPPVESPGPEFPAPFTPASPGHQADVPTAESFGGFAEAPGPDQLLPVYFPEVVAAPPVPAGERRKTGWRRWLPIAGVISFLLAGAVGMLLFLGVDIGIVGLSVGLGAAVLPVPLLVASFLWLDRYEPEPIRYLAFCFAWGAAIATSVALFVNTGASWLFDRIGLPDALVAVLVAPFIEESMKAAGPILLFWRRRSEWSGITDGIVYCGLSALGFAMVENVLYLGKHGYEAGVEQYGPATGLQNLFAIFIVRILFTGFAHPLFTSMTGIGLGISSRSGDRRVRWLAPIAGLLLAMMLHGTFNLLPTLSVSLAQPLIMLYGYLGFMVPFFFAVVGFAIALRSWEGRLTERILPYYVRAGWYAPPEVAALGSLGRRHSARQWARRVSGPAGQRAMRSFQFASTQLALLRDGMQRGLDRKPSDVARAAAEEQRLLASIVEYRSVFGGRDPQTPQAFWDGHNYQIAFPDGVTRTVAPPAEPVVPVPIRFARPPAYPVHPGGYGGGYAAPGYGVRPTTPGYGAPPPAPGYGAPGYGPPSYGGPAYGAPGHGGMPGYPAPPPYPAQPTHGAQQPGPQPPG